MPDVYREYLRLTEDRYGAITLRGSLPGDRDAEALLCGPPAADLVSLTTADATALRNALTQWLMDVEAADG